MRDEEIAENLSFELKNKLNLKASQEIIVTLINSILSKHPALRKLLSKNKDNYTGADLQKIMSYLSSDKRLNKKVFRKIYVEKVKSTSQEEFNKSMVYDFIILSLYIYLSLIISLIRLNKIKRTWDKYLKDEKKSQAKIFNNIEFKNIIKIKDIKP